MKNITTSILLILIIICLGILLCYKFVNKSKYVPNSDNLLTSEDIKLLEVSIGTTFPESTKQVTCYYSGLDNDHIWLKIKFKSQDMTLLKKVLSWKCPDELSKEKLELLTYPLDQLYSHQLSGKHKACEWWNPNLKDIIWIHESEQHEDNLSMNLQIMISKDDNDCCLYITKSWYPKAPEALRNIFSNGGKVRTGTKQNRLP